MRNGLEIWIQKGFWILSRFKRCKANINMFARVALDSGNKQKHPNDSQVILLEKTMTWTSLVKTKFPLSHSVVKFLREVVYTKFV